MSLKQKLKNDINYYNNSLSKPKVTNVINIVMYFSLFIIPLLFIPRTLDGDSWFLLNSGRYIANNGFATIEPFLIHQNMNFIFQQWLTDYYFWIIFEKFGQSGLLLCIYFETVVLNILLYILLNFIGNNKTASFLGIVLFNIFAKCYYVVRPQVTTMINLILLLICLEKYAKSNDKKWLFPLQLISILEINLHSSIWWMLFIFTLPYIFDFINIKALGLKGDRGYKKINIIIADIVMFIVGFINPYTYKAVFYLFNSMSSKYKNGISELAHFNLSYKPNIAALILIFIIIITYCYEVFRKNEVFLSRYIYIFIGCVILYFNALRSIVFFAITLSIMFVILTKDFIKLNNISKLLLDIFLCVIGVLILISKPELNQYSASQNQLKEVRDYLLEQTNNPEDINLYTSFNDGSFFEFFGFRCYMDARMEVFIKKINNQYDYFDEYSEISNGTKHYNTVFEKYDFDYYVVNKRVAYYQYLLTDSNYESIFSNESYDLFIRKE